MSKFIKALTHNSPLSSTQIAILILAVFFSACLGYYYTSAYWAIPPIWGLFSGIILGLVAFFLGISFQNSFGNLTYKFHMGRTANWSLREQLSGDISIAKNYKMQRKDNDALKKINQVLLKEGFREQWNIKPG